MQGTLCTRNVKVIEAALASARALVVSLEAALAQSEPEPDLLDAKATMVRYGVGRDGLLAAARRGEIELIRGPRNRVLVDREEIERWLRSRPHRPTQRRAAPANDLAGWDREAERELRALGGGE